MPVTRTRRGSFITPLQLEADLVRSAAVMLLGIHKAYCTLTRDGILNAGKPAGSLEATSSIQALFSLLCLTGNILLKCSREPVSSIYVQQKPLFQKAQFCLYLPLLLLSFIQSYNRAVS